MPDQKLKAKKLPLQQQLIEDAKIWGAGTLQKLFGLTQGWEKHRDIVRNNYDLGCKHLALGNVRDAILRFKMVTWLEPKHAEGWYQLGVAYVADGQLKLAKDALTRSLQFMPGNDEAVYMLAIANAGKMPPEQLPKKMPIALSLAHFDKLAADFTRTQLETYHYQGHTLLAAAIHAAMTPGRIDHVILELGVGTGLLGPLMRDVTAQLTGIEMSEPMLDEAMALQDEKGKKIYDALIKHEIGDFLRAAAAEIYDVVMAAGVFSYIGDLKDIVPQVSRALKQGGIFAFTADKMDGDGFALDATAGRFRFSKSYLEGLASASGFKIIALEAVPVYPDYNAWLCVFRR